MYRIDQFDKEAILSTLGTKSMFRYKGKNVESLSSKFEQKFSLKMGHSQSLLVSSGTNALVVALLHLDIGPGDEVVVPSYTFFATIASVLMVGAKPVFWNVEDDLTYSIQSFENVIGPQTKAVIVVHMDGICNIHQSLFQLAEKKKILVIEDCAQSMGGFTSDFKSGVNGSIACYSLNQDKIISTGEGGIVSLNNSSDISKTLALHDVCCQLGPTFRDDFNERKYLGISARVSELTAGFAISQLDKLDDLIDELKKKKQILIERIADEFSEGSILPVSIDGDLCGTSIWVQSSDPLSAKELSAKMIQAGIENYPLSLRPGHNPWGYLDLLREDVLPRHLKAHYTQGFFDQFTKSFFLGTVETLSRTLKVNVALPNE